MEYTTASNLIIEKLESTFPKISLPDDKIIKSKYLEKEGKFELGIVRGKEWSEISPFDTYRLQDFWYLFTDEALIAYIPAFFVACCFPEKSDISPGYLALALTQIDPHIFTAEQKSTIIEVISLLTELRELSLTEIMERKEEIIARFMV